MEVRARKQGWGLSKMAAPGWTVERAGENWEVPYRRPVASGLSYPASSSWVISPFYGRDCLIYEPCFEMAQ